MRISDISIVSFFFPPKISDHPNSSNWLAGGLFLPSPKKPTTFCDRSHLSPWCSCCGFFLRTKQDWIWVSSQSMAHSLGLGCYSESQKQFFITVAIHHFSFIWFIILKQSSKRPHSQKVTFQKPKRGRFKSAGFFWMRCVEGLFGGVLD